MLLKADFYEANCAANSPRKFSRRSCFFISTQRRILAPLSLLISYIMTPNVNTLQLIRKRILILNLMLLHRKKQNSKKSARVRKILYDRTKKEEFNLLVRDVRLHDHKYQCFLHSPWFQASCEAFRREKLELVSTFSSAHSERKLLRLLILKFRGEFAAQFASWKSTLKVKTRINFKSNVGTRAASEMDTIQELHHWYELLVVGFP